MPTIADFPDDDHLWMVKWIDEFSPYHYESRSPSVAVRLQRLPFSDPKALSRLNPKAVAELLGGLQSNPSFTDCRVHVGTLPLIAIGRVYQRQQLVGELPAKRHSLSLPRSEESCSSVRVHEGLAKPPGWGDKYPYRTLSRREFNGIDAPFDRSRCLVFFDPGSGITYVIPRIVIFQRFYAIHTEIAGAFAPGPWHTTKSDVVYEKPLKSGLLTQVDPVTGDWHVILQTHVPDDYHLLVALLYFDKFASHCAEQIYTEALKDKQNNNVWYASARLPFRPDDRPLKLLARGFMLNERWGPNLAGKTHRVRQTFLVTSIPGVAWPKYVPPVWFERFNSGVQGETIHENTDDPPPYGPRGETHGGPRISITSQTDSSSEHQAYIADDDTVHWIDPPPERKLVKEHSDRYAGTPAPHGEESEATLDASSGMRTSQEGNPSQIRSGQTDRPPVERYRLLINALDHLVEIGNLTAWRVIQPVERFQTELRDGFRCWNFFTHEEGNSLQWPRSGWRLIARGPRWKAGLARSALAISIEHEGKSGIWIEIEARKSESGMASPFLFGPNLIEHDAVDEMIQVIASCEGTSIRKTVEQKFAERNHLQVAWYTHIYDSEHKALNPDSICRFLKRIKW